MIDMQFLQQRIEAGFNGGGIVVIKLKDGAHIFRNGQPAEYRSLLRQVAEPQAGAAVHRHVRHPDAVEMQFAAVHRHQSDHHVKTGRFAGAVRAQQADDFSTAHLK